MSTAPCFQVFSRLPISLNPCFFTRRRLGVFSGKMPQERVHSPAFSADVMIAFSRAGPIPLPLCLAAMYRLSSATPEQTQRMETGLNAAYATILSPILTTNRCSRKWGGIPFVPIRSLCLKYFVSPMPNAALTNFDQRRAVKRRMQSMVLQSCMPRS